MPWIEDKYLSWYGENKTSYSTKETLKTRAVDDKNVNAIQDGLAEGVGGQVASGGLLGGVGDAVSKEGFNRAETADTQKPKGWTETLSGGYVGAGLTSGQQTRKEGGKGWTETVSGGYLGGGQGEKEGEKK